MHATPEAPALRLRLAPHLSREEAEAVVARNRGRIVDLPPSALPQRTADAAMLDRQQWAAVPLLLALDGKLDADEAVREALATLRQHGCFPVVKDGEVTWVDERSAFELLLSGAADSDDVPLTKLMRSKGITRVVFSRGFTTATGRVFHAGSFAWVDGNYASYLAERFIAEAAA